jgi:hypothetical protein
MAVAAVMVGAGASSSYSETDEENVVVVTSNLARSDVLRLFMSSDPDIPMCHADPFKYQDIYLCDTDGHINTLTQAAPPSLLNDIQRSCAPRVRFAPLAPLA